MMHHKFLQFVAAAVICVVVCADACATSGWDRHQIDIDGKFRIHGVHGVSYVHRLDAAGRVIEPPLCSSQGIVTFGVPPDYAVTETYLVVRYPMVHPNYRQTATARCCFAIRRSDGQVFGIASLEELQRTLGIDYSALQWETPATPSAWPLALFMWFPLLLVPLLLGLIALCYGIFRWNRRRRSCYNNTNGLGETSTPGA